MSSKYEEKLKVLKTNISNIRKKKKKFKKVQSDMIKFIHREIKEILIEVQNKKVFLKYGNENKGFKHIIEKHYNETSDLETMDIINFSTMFKNAIKLNDVGVSNKNLAVYKRTKNMKEHILVVDENNEKKLVVTSYRKMSK